MTAAGPLGGEETPSRLATVSEADTTVAGRIDAAERDAYAVLASVASLGPITLGRTVAAYGSAAEAVEAAATPAGAAAVVAAGRRAGRTDRDGDSQLATQLLDAVRRRDALLGEIARARVSVLTIDDDAYPRRLRAIELPPPVLFVRGDAAALSPGHAIAVVGTRRPTQAGRSVAEQIAYAVGMAGATVVSGLAVGIDGAAHDAVVRIGRPTVAVLGGGHARLFPAAHTRLAEAIVASGGAIVSEYPPATAPQQWTFPRRNRVIAGLADAAVVVEAGLRSGALITAAWALEQGRGCFLVPGGLDAPASAGCLAFLRECSGVARIVAGVPELLEDLALVEAAPLRRRPPDRHSTSVPAGPAAALARLGPAARAVAAAVAAGRSTLDDLVSAMDFPAAAILAALTLLEDHGLVTAAYGRYRPTGSLAVASPRRRAVTQRVQGSVRPDGSTRSASRGEG